MSATVYPLRDNQRLAVSPGDSVWLSASAGTGKTQVLSARVLRLLLRPDVAPGQILCLTFTKAGAAEMATRVNEVLASWVRLEPPALAADLFAIGADGSPATVARARTLFASVLDCPGGGLRIDTIHAFSQWLLAAFPQEAGLVPGTRPMEDRDRDLLAHRVLAELVARWEREGGRPATAALEALAVRLGEDKARAWLMRCAEAREAWFGPGAWQPPMRARVEALLGLPEGASDLQLAQLCTDEVFDCTSLKACLAAHVSWGTKSGRECAEAIEVWLAGGDRLAGCAALEKALFTKEGAPRALKSLVQHDPDYATSAEAVAACLAGIAQLRTLIELAEFVTPALEIGRRFALAWDEAKTREGLIDFDDLIRRAAALLATPGLGEWIRYKLDRSFDHILIDEAQDTNSAQWSIIDALTEEYFTGLGQRDGRLRTIFVVGDYKQAIFRFQGTSPENFRAARERFKRAMAQNAASAGTMREAIEARELVELGLGRSFRTAQPVLDFVDEAIDAIGPAAFGLGPDHQLERHIGDARPGLVALWRPVSARPDESDAEDDGPEGWISQPERRMADRIAAQVKAWLDRGFPLVKGASRHAGPGDVMVLVRKRRELAGLIVARLHTAGVPVAGVDRLRLGAPLAVKDLMAALKVAAQPLDSLSLAALLVSPLVGWSQEQLLRHAWRAPQLPLWEHLRRSPEPEAQAAAEQLRALLARADFEPPQALLAWLLVGPWQGRRRLVARLGREANDPIDELLAAAFAYSAAHTPSLQGFIQWFDAGEGELKREPGADAGLVRVMTVHGSKGLQAPIVILADATGNPDSSPPRGLDLTEDLPGGGGRTVPLPDLPREQRIGPIAAAAEAAARAEREEHWRLLYVAMTRAEEALFIGGALGKRESEPAPDSWFARLAPLFGSAPLDDPLWGWRFERGVRAGPITRREQGELPMGRVLPAWTTRPPGEEPRPPRPLAPSAAGEEQGSEPPLPPREGAAAARRGVLIHALLERLPDVPPAEREQRGAAWLARHASDLDAPARTEMLSRAMAVIAQPQWAQLFSPAALAEAPLAAIVGGQVIAGTADRLLVLPQSVLVVDYKTARRPPAGLADMPAATLRQMAAYAAALAAIYPGRPVEAAVLYTQTPQLIAIPPELLVPPDPELGAGRGANSGYPAVQESYEP